jgi:hypothetical protein
MLNIDINADQSLVTLRPTGVLFEIDFARRKTCRVPIVFEE